MNVGIFYNSITNPRKFPNKLSLMDNFRDGVVHNGDTAVEFQTKFCDIPELDAGFILGYTLENNFRKHIIQVLEQSNCPRIFVDSNILNYANPINEWHRYSLNSVYPSTGEYFFGDIDKTKWDNFSQFHDVELKPWRRAGDHVLILCQRSNGWNLFGQDQLTWIKQTVTEIRQNSDREIIVRLHPGDKSSLVLRNNIQYLYEHHVRVSVNENIKQDLENCWCTVGYNSTPNVVSIIEGIPNIITDPKTSWANGVAGTKINSIEHPIMPDREEWIHRIANIHWSNDEVKSGKLWSQIKSYISSARS
jgi:hypothetical protein